MRFHRLMDLTSHRANGAKGILRVLKNGGDLLPQQAPSFFRAHFQKGLPFEVYVTGSDAPIGGKQPQDGFTERGMTINGILRAMLLITTRKNAPLTSLLLPQP